MFLINKRSRIVFLFSIFLCLLFTAGALAAERAVIIGFHQRPGPAEQALIHSAGGAAHRAFHLIPAMAAKVPEQALEGLRRNPHVAYVEDDAVVSAIDVEVYEAGALVKDLFESFRFGGKNQSEVTFGDLDAKDMAYHVVFVPKGKEGAFATVDIREVQ